MKYIFISLILVILLLLSNSQSYAGWLIYHKPEFRGRVFDAETKEPIEGAVVVVVYNKFRPGLTGTGGNTLPMKAKETLTDKNGEFHFPSYTTIIQPLTTEDSAEFIIYKPGYGSFPNYQTVPSTTDQESFFSKKIGDTGELAGGVNTTVKVTFGIVELPKLKSREERLNAMPSPPTDITVPLLFKAINEERRKLGLKGEYK